MKIGPIPLLIDNRSIVFKIIYMLNYAILIFVRDLKGKMSYMQKHF